MCIESIFLENFIINFILFSEIEKIIKIKFMFKRKIFSILLGSLYISLFKILTLDGVVYRISNYLLIAIMVYIVMKPENIKQYIKFFLIYIYQNIFLIGTISFFLILGLQNKIVIYVISVYLLIFLNTKVTDNIKYVLETFMNSTVIKFNIGKEEYIFKTMLDTGNKIRYKGEGVIVLINKNGLINKSKTFKSKDKITVSTLNSNRALDVYIIKNVNITRKNTNIVISEMPVLIIDRDNKFSNEYESIIGLSTYIKYYGGI